MPHCYLCFFRLSVQQIADLFESNEFWADFDANDGVQSVFIEPPDNRELSDEDSADEDNGGLMDNLSGKQLQARAELVMDSGARVGNFDDLDDDDNIPEDVPLSTFVNKKVENLKWLKQMDLLSQDNILSQEPDTSEYRNLSPVELFELFITDDIITFLVEESNKYALFKNCPSPNITKNEIRCFLAILIVSGYDKKPSKKSYWDSGDDLRNIAVYKAMRRDRFVEIMKFFHCADNTKLNPKDKMAKLRPLVNKLKDTFSRHFVPQMEISYDESMIEYYGHHGCKQFIRGKPIRFGYKCWCMNSKNGYLINFEIYQGAIPNSNLEHQKEFGKATAPLIQLILELPEQKRSFPYRFYFDNLFTSIKFLSYLKKQGYNGTGTIRENRLPKNCPITNVKSMKKTTRGHFDYAVTEDKSIVVTRWMDNSVVTVASTIHPVFPLSNAQRYSAAEKKKISIKRPGCIEKYNQFMGGTDQMDANINVYRISLRGKKWWWPIFTWLIDAAIQNAWILHKIHYPETGQLDFRREIASTYLKKFQNLPKSGGRPATYSKDSKISPDIRLDKTDHLVEYVPNNKRRRCVGQNHKGSSVRTQCRKCDIGLCIDCFVDFHTK